ncbi:MAG: type II toxin-antitoxin system Phd/YefM family antitoxin [Deinococcales bacterium]
MRTQTTYSDARANFAKLLDTVTDNREIVVVRRRGKDDVAMIALDELERLLETAYLYRSPANLRHFEESVQQAKNGQTQEFTVEELRQRLGL